MADDQRVTSVRAYVKASVGTDQVDATKVLAYVKVREASDDIRATVGMAYVKAFKAWPTSLDASLVTFLRVQAAKQTTFDSPVAPTFGLPVVFDYADAQMEQVAGWDAGLWTPTEIVEQTADFATFTLRGALFFEMLPVFLQAGFGEMAPSGVGPYNYAGSVVPGAAGSGSIGPLPRWAIYEVASGTLTSSGLGAAASVVSISTAGPVVDKYLWIAPPPNTKRMVITGSWSSNFSSPSGGSCGSNVDALDAISTTLVDDLVHSVPTPNTADGETSGTFTATFTFASFATLDWPVNTSNYAGASNADASRFRAYSDTTGSAVSTTTVSVTVTEIELDDGTIYTPPASETATGAPLPYTFRFGGNDSSVAAGSMVQVQDAYLHKLVLSFNLNQPAVTFESTWFGRFVDDNGGAGYQPEAVTLPPNLGMVNGLLSTLAIQDAGAAGGAFDNLAAFECSLMEWQLVIDTGLRPAWSSDGNGLTYCGVRHEWPTATWAAHLRTMGANYAVTKVKSNLRTYQELRLSLLGADNRQLLLSMTGRWLPKFVAHDRSREEVVMRPIFSTETPASQTTTPHWLSYDILSRWGGA